MNIKNCIIGTCLSLSLCLTATAQPDLDDPGWRWQAGVAEKTTKKQYQTSHVPDMTIYPDPSHRGDYNVRGAENFFRTLSDGMAVYARVRRIRALGRLGEQTISGPVGKETYKALMGQLSKAGGDQAGVPIPTSIHDVALNYLRFESWVADTILQAGARIGRSSKQKWLIAKGELELETFEWTCAPIEVHTANGWVAGGYRMKKPVKLVSVDTTRKVIPDISGEPIPVERAVTKLELWGRQIKKRQPELRWNLLKYQENPCAQGLCDHPRQKQALISFEDTVAETKSTGAAPTPPPLKLGHRQDHQRIHDLRRILDFSKRDLTQAETNLAHWDLQHKPADPTKSRQLDKARAERERARLAFEGVRENRENAVDFPTALAKARERLDRAETAVRALEKELFKELSEVDKLTQKRLQDKVNRAKARIARDQKQLDEARAGHEGCHLERDEVKSREPQRFDVRP